MFSVDSRWISQLSSNLVEYSVILIPTFLLVVIVKSNWRIGQVLRKSTVLRCLALSRNEWAGADAEHLSRLKLCEDSFNIDDEEIFNRKASIAKISSKVSHGAIETCKVDEANNESTRFRNLVTFASCAIGLNISFVIWGLYQEKIMVQTYSTNGGLTQFKFMNSQFLVLSNRTSSFLLSATALIISFILLPPARKFVLFNAPYYTYLLCALTNVISSWCQIEALKYVTFPVQVLSKACKIIPVMLVGHVCMKKSYDLLDYATAFAITGGAALFFNEYASFSVSKENIVQNLSITDGILILSLFLIFDAFTSNWQSYLFDKYNPSAWEMMAAVNFFSIMLTASSLYESNSLQSTIEMVLSSDELLKDCVILSIVSAIGQAFVFYTISLYGPLYFIIIMTIRQVLSLAISTYTFGHYMSILSVLGVVIIFCALFAKAFVKLILKGFIKK